MMKRITDWIGTHRYCLAGLYAIVFLAGFFLMELIRREPVHIIHCALDDLIPFNEYFIIPYSLWYLWVPVFFFYFMFTDRDAYLQLVITMFGGATICLFIYFFWPNGLDLRQPIESENICARLLEIIRLIDPPTNVCPSIHVSSTVSILFTIQGSRRLKGKTYLKALAWVVTFAICLATLFIKQHSVIDVICGWLLAILMEVIYLAGRRLMAGKISLRQE